MALSPAQKHSLLQQLYHLSTDTQLHPYLDSTTTQRITKLLQASNFINSSIIGPPINTTKHSQSITQKKYKTEMEEIQEINKQYERRFGDLFGDNDLQQQEDEEYKEKDFHVLKEIDVRLVGNTGHNNCFVDKKKTKYENNFVQKISQQQDLTHAKTHQLSNKNLKQTFTKTSTKKQNINSLTSTHSNLFNPKMNDQLIILKKRPSKQKLISYKIKTQVSDKYGYEMCTPVTNKLLKKKEKTPSKNILTVSQSKSNLQQITKSPISQISSTNNNNNLMKRSQSQSTKFLITTNPGSLNSTSKNQKLPLLRTSESKSSLSTSKLKSASKKSISLLETTTATKRQAMGSLPSIDDNRARVSKDETGSVVKKKIDKRTKSKSKSKEKYTDVSMKKQVKRSHTQCSVEKMHLRDDFLEQMRVDQQLNFEVTKNDKNDGKKSQKKIQKLQQKHDKENNSRRVVTEMFSKQDKSQQQYFYESSQEFQQQQQQQQNSSQSQKQLSQDQPIACFYEDQPLLTPTKPKYQQKSQKITMNQLHDTKTAGYQCLKRIMSDINQQRQQKMREKVYYERQIAELKQKIIQQKKCLQSTLITNSKYQNQLYSLSTQIKSTTNQRSLLTRCIQQSRKLTSSLKQNLTKNNSLLQKLTQQQLKQQQQLIEMYQKVIEELKLQIKEQLSKKLQVKAQLEVCNKKRQGKLTKFNSTLLSSQKLKFNLTDAFREWV